MHQSRPETVLAGVVAAIRAVTGLEQVDPTARLEGDLQLESVDLVALDGLLQQRYGAGVDLLGFVSDLDIDQLIGLTVSDVVGRVEAVAS
jgi:acyl carrier protein